VVWGDAYQGILQVRELLPFVEGYNLRYEPLGFRFLELLGKSGISARVFDEEIKDCAEGGGIGINGPNATAR
jgi:hypothetical protein